MRWSSIVITPTAMRTVESFKSLDQEIKSFVHVLLEAPVVKKHGSQNVAELYQVNELVGRERL